MIVCMRTHRSHPETHLVMMRGADKDDWPITRDVESTAGTDLSEEYLGNHPPEHQSRFVCDFRHFEDGTGASYKVLCEKGHEGEKGNEASDATFGDRTRASGVNTAKFNVGIHNRLQVGYHYYYDILLPCADDVHTVQCQATEVSAR